MSDPDRLAEIRQRRAAISPIPWRFDRDWGLRPIVDADDEVVVYDEGSPGDADAEFIVHTPADIDWLIGQMMHARFDAEKGRQENERLRGLLRRLATETLLARAVIHELVWGQIPITDHPQLHATLKAWGEDDKLGTPEVKRLAKEIANG